MGRKKLSTSNPRKNEKEIGKATIDRIVAKPVFEYFDQPQVGVRFHLFRERGEELVGRLVGHSIQNIRRNSSWPIKLESGEVVEVFANKTLSKQLHQCSIFTKIRIVYIGREHGNFGHAKKIYRVYKIKE